MSVPLDKVRDDFDRIARLVAAHGERPGSYDEFLLRQVPPACATALDVGCGTGAFSRALAARGCRVLAVDLSPEMIRVARSLARPGDDVAYECADVLAAPLPEEAFDCVVSIATLHHLPLDAAVARLASLVRPGGVLVLHDLRADADLADRFRSGVALAAAAAARLRATGRLRQPAEVRAAWRDHGRGERYLTMPEVLELSRTRLPGARAHRHLFWRYTVVWTKPGPLAAAPPA